MTTTDIYTCIQPSNPGPGGFLEGLLVQVVPRLEQRHFQVVDSLHFIPGTGELGTEDAPDAVVHDIEVWRLGRPVYRLNEVGGGVPQPLPFFLFLATAVPNTFFVVTTPENCPLEMAPKNAGSTSAHFERPHVGCSSLNKTIPLRWNSER